MVRKRFQASKDLITFESDQSVDLVYCLFSENRPVLWRLPKGIHIMIIKNVRTKLDVDLGAEFALSVQFVRVEAG